ncbi:hypothetical protein HOLleu_11693 [Holothuria leucospilota]|uniref:Uncharacterized protein n=1 Tax=Holothuria leucospilota TaxID=206669 RepID=A0A9Q1CG23_HOLLE|nr:hypothetical protein HOLleu_11693 [Holothuria leucospilota]
MATKIPVLMTFVLLWMNVVYCMEQIHLKDLRQLRIQGIASRITVSRNALKDFLDNITGVCDLEPFLFKSGSNENLYDPSLIGEVDIGYFVIHDHTLNGISYKLKEKVATSYRLAGVSVPFVSGGRHGFLILALFTDSDKKVFFPYSTNHDHITYIDEIEETEDGTITLRHGNDVLVMNTQHNDTCGDNQRQHVRQDFDKILGKQVTGTDYPLPFDWGCDVLGDDVDFCDILKENKNELEKAGPNVCTEMTITSQSKRCPATMEFQEITGFFRNALPFLSTYFGSFEAEWIDREHGGGIIFPCLIFS